MLLEKLIDLPQRVFRRVNGDTRDYRHFLFDELRERLGGRSPSNILEIGPRDGQDTRRLLSLRPKSLVLAELPNHREFLEERLTSDRLIDDVEIRYGNVMYDQVVSKEETFEVIWCTGVLYHNPEQLRFVIRLSEWLKPDGLLVIETATARRFPSRYLNCVEVWEGESAATHKRYHVSNNVIHLPSKQALRSWLTIAGFSDIKQSGSLARQSLALARVRGAYICKKSGETSGSYYYRHTGGNYRIGHSL